MSSAHDRYSRREVLRISGRAVGLAAAGATMAGCTNAVTQQPPAALGVPKLT